MGPCTSKAAGKKKEPSEKVTEQKTNNNANKESHPSETGPITSKATISGKNVNIGPGIFVSLKKGTLSMDYKIGEVLGEGAYGKVCQITHRTTGMIRAMKSIKKSSILKEEEDRMFAEMNILKNLDHPNILKLYELYQDDNNYYLITEYLSGGELFDKIKTYTSFTEKMAADFMKQILSAVVYCHTQNVCHRDLKPENLILESNKPNSNLKVIDFGTSRKFESNKKMTKRLGTPYYIAPEVLEGNYNEKCDVWSCGIILYILLCGYPPFTGSTEQEILSRVRQGKYEFDPDDWDHISNEAKKLIQSMLTLKYNDRPSAQECLNNPWIQKNTVNTYLSTKCLQNITSFHAKNKLKQAILTFIATQIVSQQDREELEKTFKTLDKDADGRITRDELVEGYMKIHNNKEYAENEVDKIISEIDTNSSGVVDFTEFIVAAMQREKMLSKQRTEMTFKIFDTNGDGTISREELKNIMGGAEFDEQTWNEMLDEVDINRDGMISQDEFLELLSNKIKL